MPLSRKSKKGQQIIVKEEDEVDFHEVKEFDQIVQPTLITSLKESPGQFQVTVRVRKLLKCESKKK